MYMYVHTYMHACVHACILETVAWPGTHPSRKHGRRGRQGRGDGTPGRPSDAGHLAADVRGNVGGHVLLCLRLQELLRDVPFSCRELRDHAITQLLRPTKARQTKDSRH